MVAVRRLFRCDRLVLVALALALAASMSAGCTHVMPYQRGKLAHPTMATDDIAGPAEAHMRSVQEGATGGSASAESGCGCN